MFSFSLFWARLPCCYRLFSEIHIATVYRNVRTFGSTNSAASIWLRQRLRHEIEIVKFLVTREGTVVMWSCPLCEVNAASIWFTIILAQYTSHNGEAYNDSSQCMMYSLTILDWQHPSRIHSFCSWNIPICTTSLIWISMRSISKTAALLCGVIFCRILI
jgi:hypothetical protein